MPQIRDCAAEDLDALERAMPSHGVYAAHLQRATAGDAGFLVAWQEEAAVGTGLIRWGGDREAAIRVALAGTPAISNLAVGESHRSLGIGTALIQALEDRARQRSYRQVSVTVGIDNPAAARLYRRLGYRDTELTAVSHYEVTDDAGTLQQVTEHVVALVKRL